MTFKASTISTYNFSKQPILRVRDDNVPEVWAYEILFKSEFPNEILFHQVNPALDWQIFLKALDYLCIKPNGSFYTVNMFHATFVENYSQLVQIFDTHNLRNQLFIELIEHNGSSKCPENLKNPEKIPVIIDDFGYGFSNYEHIFSLLPHAIKLDRLFLKMPERFVMELVMCFQSYGIDVVFEKCETQEELRWAKQMGFNYWQGYYANIVSHRHNLNYAQKETFTNV